jgi:hypothetical protein
MHGRLQRGTENAYVPRSSGLTHSVWSVRRDANTIQICGTFASARTQRSSARFSHLPACRGITYGRRAAAFQGRVNGATRLPRACAGGRRRSGRTLKVTWSLSLFKGVLAAPIFSTTPLPESAVSTRLTPWGRNLSRFATKNDHETSGSRSGKKSRVGR